MEPGRLKMKRLAALACGTMLMASGLMLPGCSKKNEAEPAASDKIPEEVASKPSDQPAEIIDPGIGTPLAERVATLGLLNKRNNISQDIEMRPGEEQRLGNVIIRLASCERTLPWEHPQEIGAFVQLLVQERRSVDDPLRWHRVFSGWLFRHSPSLNVVEHPVYDVWVKDCAMNFPGEEATDKPPAGDAAPRSTSSSPSSAPAAPPATPPPSAEPAAPADTPAADSNAP